MAADLPDVGAYLKLVASESSPDAVLPRFLSTVRSVQTFEWETGVTAFSHPSWPVVALLAYSITIYTLHSWMKDRPRFKLLLVTRYHNLFLSMWSLFMCVGASYTLIRAMMDGYTFSDLVCDNKDGNSRGALMKALGFWAYHYYISKFYELLDTVLLVLKKKPLTTLHVYHHIMMVSTTWMWCHNGLTMHWFAIVVNCLVHVFMYYYYYKASFMKYRPWWRPLITKGQIVQFCAGMGTSFVWQYNSFENFRFSSSFPFIDYDKSICSGSPYLVLWSQWLTMSLLVLFSIFFYTTFVLKRDRKLAAEAEAEAAKKGN